jgi:sugar lactone lactonase YvrE
VALFFGAGVAVFSPEGAELRRIAVEVPVVTSVCFGGDDWRDLYVVTGPCATPGGQAAAGRVYRMRAPVAGRRRPLARVAISNH